MTVNDIFTICRMSMIYNPTNGQILHRFTDICSNLPVLLDPAQYNICVQTMKQYTNDSFFPSAICLSGHFVHDSSAIYADCISSIYMINLNITTTYIDIVNETATFRDEITDLPVVIDNFPDEEYTRFSAELIGLTLQGYDFSKEGYDRIIIAGNIRSIDNNIIYKYDKSILASPTLDFVNIMFDSIQRRIQ